MTSAAVHLGQGASMQELRSSMLATAYRAHPARVKEKHRTPPAVLDIVGLNLFQPQPTGTTQGLTMTSVLHTFLNRSVSTSLTLSDHLIIAPAKERILNERAHQQ
jgi:hypothetical protein